MSSWLYVPQATEDNADVTSMMDTWTLQMGYPVVNVTKTKKRVTATQQRFLIYPEGMPSTEFNSSFG